MIWPFTTNDKRKHDEEAGEQASSTIHKQIETINELVSEIRGDNKKTKNLNGSKHTTG